MGTSFEILKKEFTLSLEVDSRIAIEISTGWEEKPRNSRCGISIEISVDELTTIIKELTDVRDKLLTSNICEKCGLILPPDEDCYNCES